MRKWFISKWCAVITDTGADVYPNYEGINLEDYPERFRLLDDDKKVYAYGIAMKGIRFQPLDCYRELYGCTEIQYYAQQGEWKTL